MSSPRTLTAAVHQEEDWYVAQCLEVDVASQGQTIEEALANLAEAVGLYLEGNVASQGQTIEEALANLAEAVGLYLDEVDDPSERITSTPLVTSFQVPGAA